MAKNAHLTLDDRCTIELSLRDGDSFADIGKELGKDPSTIAKEIKNHIQLIRSSSYNPCVKRTCCSFLGSVCKECIHPYHPICKSCKYRDCSEQCSDFLVLTCQKLSKPPYVCNSCDTRHRCKLERHLYNAKNAQKEYEAQLSESRKGIAITPAELKRIDAIKKTARTIIKQMVIIRMVLDVKEYHADVYYNSQTGERVHAAFPDGVIDDVNYDGSIRAFLFFLNNDCCTSIDKSRKFLSDLTDEKLNISKSMISKLSREFALKTEPERKAAYADMLLSTVMHTGAGCDIQEFRKYRLSLPMHEHACFDAPRRTNEYI